ncbi:unnamed protein product [Anisakis simplex]|uniref:Uncharacterized protein n=1 Tax=Anisakis simplex TaxID=6269 RepID=A0A0M3JEB8_ANISI|nr:unnamed protein product [Anisakis simplex]
MMPKTGAVNAGSLRLCRARLNPCLTPTPRYQSWRSSWILSHDLTLTSRFLSLHLLWRAILPRHHFSHHPPQSLNLSEKAQSQW